MTALVWRHPATLLLCALAGLGWIAAPVGFQKFMEAVLSGGMTPRAFGYAALCAGLVCGAAAVEILRFRCFAVTAPQPAAGSSLPSKLAQLRIWTVGVPNAVTNGIILIGGLACLLLRDARLCAAVCAWSLLSYFAQGWVGRRVEDDARKFRSGGLEESASLGLQADLLKWQVLGGSLNSVLKISGQLLIYSVIFGMMALELSGRPLAERLPAVLANLEYVGMVLGSLQALLSSWPQLRELQVYLREPAPEAKLVNCAL